MELRDYQRSGVDIGRADVLDGKDPCVVIPGAGGKSIIIAEQVRQFVEVDGLRVLMLVDTKELIQQNANKLRELWRDLYGTQAPLGVYSASLKRKELGRPITYGGIQSVQPFVKRNGPMALGWIDVVIVDEAHMIPTKGEGQYRSLIAMLREANPNLRVVGWTATPWRLGHGDIASGEGALFNSLHADIVSVRELVDRGFTAPLRSKHTGVKLLDLVGDVHKRGGDFVESELAAAVNKNEPNELIAAEIVARGTEEDRRHCLLFCVSIDHCKEMARILTGLGKPSGVIHGEMSDLERTDALNRFRAGEWWGLANVMLLTKGWDFPDLDMMAWCRPTLSPVLYSQIAFRGMRLKTDGTTPHRDCYILDFAGLVSTHGPITDVRPPRARGAKPGECPIKNCPICAELVLISCMLCPSCGYEWEAPKKDAKLHNDDIMAERRKDGVAEVARWTWFYHTSQQGKRMLAVEYEFKEAVEPEGTDEESLRNMKPRQRATEYWPVFTEDWARSKLKKLAEKLGVELTSTGSIMIERLNAAPHPETVKLSLKAGWIRVGRPKWAALPEKQETAA